MIEALEFPFQNSMVTLIVKNHKRNISSLAEGRQYSFTNCTITLPVLDIFLKRITRV